MAWVGDALAFDAVAALELADVGVFNSENSHTRSLKDCLKTCVGCSFQGSPGRDVRVRMGIPHGFLGG